MPPQQASYVYSLPILTTFFLASHVPLVTVFEDGVYNVCKYRPGIVILFRTKFLGLVHAISCNRPND